LKHCILSVNKSSLNLKDMKKKVIILGASSDIGKPLLNYFLNDKYEVYAHYNKVKPKIKSKRLHYIKCDFSIEGNFKNFMDEIKKISFSSFINLIGFIDGNDVEKTNFSKLTNSLNINLKYPILIANEVSKKMKANKFGRILHCSSIGVKFGGGINSYSYSIAKHGLEFIPSYFKSLIKYNVFYNVLRVGITKTKLHKSIKNKNMKKRVSLIPIGRMAKPIEIAKYIFYLSSKDNTFISNQVLSISGGE